MKNKKILVLFLIMITISLFSITSVNALTYGRVTNPTTTLRKGPGDNYEKGTKLYYNDTIPLLNRTLYKSEKGCPAGWLKVNLNGSIQYICSPQVSGSTVTAKSNVAGLNLRKGPGTNYAIYNSVPKGKLFTIFKTTKIKGKGCSAGWYQLNYVGDVKKYICINYITAYNTTPNAIVTNTNGTALRKSANSNSQAIVTLKYGQAATINNTTTTKGNGCSSGWYQVFYRNNTYYMCSNDILRTNTIGAINDLDTVNIRSTSNSSSSIVATLDYGDLISLYNTTKYNGAGCSAGWYKGYYNKKIVYVCSTYVSLSSNIVNTNTNSQIKSSPNNTSSTIATLNNEKQVLLTGTAKQTGAGCPAGWYKVNINGKNGYICSDDTDLGLNLNGGKRTNNPTNTTNTTTNTTNTNTNTNTTTTTTNNTTKKTNKINTASSVYYTTNMWTYRLRENYGNVRSSASTSSSIQDIIYLGTEVEVLSTSKATSDCSTGWYKIKYYNNKTGYICKSLIEKYSDVTKNDTSYCNTLKNAGFPESYCPFLSYLHSKHPSWVFKAEKTGVTFLSAINGESEKNYTQISNNARSYLQSTTIRESGGWKTASDAYVAYMLDPRNYLNEQNIFAFENLSFDSKYHTTSVIKSIVSGTYLDNDTYAGYFYNSGKTYNVSPVHLVARVKQEGGSNSSYASVSGNASGTCTITGYVCSTWTSTSDNTGRLTDVVNLRNGAGTNNSIVTEGQTNETFTLLSTTKYKGTGCNNGWYKIKLNRSLKGIYNYYNIGAYGSNPVNRGLKAAAGCIDSNDGTPWNTREKAIKYGAAFIANGYINKGQDTMYYQKFNTGPNATSSRYTHQYQTNILAPASESLSTYESYSSLKVLDKAYVFKIPVYNQMPSDFTQHPPVS